MQKLTSLTEASETVQRYFSVHGSELSEFHQNLMISTLCRPNLLDRIGAGVEILYAAKSELGLEGKNTLASLVNFASLWAVYGLSGPRGIGIQMAMQRDAGEEPPEGSSWPEPGSDPDPLEQYVDNSVHDALAP